MKMYRFVQGFGRMGELEGLFYAEDAEVAAVMGEVAYFGEVLGEGSNVICVLDETNVIEIASDEAFVDRVRVVIGEVGYNPLDYLSDGWDDPERERC